MLLFPPIKTTPRYALTSALFMTYTVSILAIKKEPTKSFDLSVVESGLVESLKWFSHKVLEIISRALASNETCAVATGLSAPQFVIKTRHDSDKIGRLDGNLL